MLKLPKTSKLLSLPTILGQVFTGIVKSENEEFVELIQNDGGQVRILLDEIVAQTQGNFFHASRSDKADV